MTASICTSSVFEPRGIAVWALPVKSISRELYPDLEELLSPEEKERAARFRFQRDRHLYLAAHALKRLQLSALMPAMEPAAWRFAPGRWGKPKVISAEDISFNLTHSRGLVACAVSQMVELGLDVEFVAPQAPMEVAAECFTPAERSWIEKAVPRQRSLRFFRLWTLKEAVLKATGKGLYQSPLSFSFDFDPLRISIRDPSLGKASQWHFSQQRVLPDHVLAVAWKGGQAGTPPAVKVMEVTFRSAS